MYSSVKVKKNVTDGLPSFTPVLCSIGTATYKLAKFLVSRLEPLPTNEYTNKDSFTFAKELQSFDSRLVMAIVDIKSHSLPAFLCKKELTFALKIYLRIGLMLIICRKIQSFRDLLTRPCLNH